MKLLNKKQKNNKGFSLVELIVVIAIMVVLVAVLAPVFTKYIESSRRSTDVQNANQIAESVMADIADGGKTAEQVNATGYVPTAIGTMPEIKGDKVSDAKGTTNWKINYSDTEKRCAVSIGKYDLTVDGSETDDTGVAGYKKQ